MFKRASTGRRPVSRGCGQRVGWVIREWSALMRLSKFAASIVLASAIVAGAPGCASERTRKNPHEQGSQQWNDARANILGTLAADQYKNGNFEKCGESLNEALQLAPKNPGLHLLAAKLCIEQGKLEPAEKQLDAARQL